MGNLLQVLCSLVIITCVRTEVSLVPSNNVVVCYGGSVTLRCTTTEGALLWRTSNSENRLFNNINQPTTLLGNFTLNVVSVISNGTSLSVTSTASLVNFQFTSSGLQLKIECEEVTVLNPSEEAFLIAAEPPPPPQHLTIQKESGNFTISWSQSNCAVQYVVTIINSADNRIYSNVTTSNSNTTVTLTTDVEFCVILVAVDSIGRRGPDTTPVCYQSTYTTQPSDNTVSTVTPWLSATVTPWLRSTITYLLSPTDTPWLSPKVTHSPVTMGGINTAAAVAVPIVLLMFLAVVVTLAMVLLMKMRRTSRYLLRHESFSTKGSNQSAGRTTEQLGNHSQSLKYTCQVFHRRKEKNQWEVLYVFFLKQYKDKVNEKYQDANQGNKIDFNFSSKQTQISPYVITEIKDWTTTTSKQLSRAAVEKYNGVGEPPCITMTLAPVSGLSEPKQGISFTVVINEIASANTISVSRAVEPISTSFAWFTPELQGEHQYCCQVFYHKENELNCWKAMCAFFLKSKQKEVEEYYQGANVGDLTEICFDDEKPVDVTPSQQMDGWDINVCRSIFTWNVTRKRVMRYKCGEPPYQEVTIKPNKANLPQKNLEVSLELTGLKQAKKITLRRALGQ